MTSYTVYYFHSTRVKYRACLLIGAASTGTRKISTHTKLVDRRGTSKHIVTSYLGTGTLSTTLKHFQTTCVKYHACLLIGAASTGTR